MKTIAGAAERTQNVLDVSCSSHQPEQEEHEENRRPEPEQQVLPPRASRVQRLGVHDHALLLEQLRQSVVVCERRDLGTKPRRRLASRVPLLLRKSALNRRPLGRDLLHVPRRHLFEEERAVRNTDAGRRLRRTRAEVKVEKQKPDCKEDPTTARAKAWQLRRRRSGRRRRCACLALILGTHCGELMSSSCCSGVGLRKPTQPTRCGNEVVRTRDGPGVEGQRVRYAAG